MLRTGDWVTLHVDSIRYLEKAPLSYWIAAASLRIFGQNAFAIHLPLALAVLGLAILGYTWARRSFGQLAAFYTGLFVLTSTGVFLFTRIFIPEALLSLLLALGLYALHLALEPQPPGGSFTAELHHAVSGEARLAAPLQTRSSLTPALLFWLSMALAVLTKGLIAIVFLLGTAGLYLTLTRTWRNWRTLRPITGLLLFLAVAAPWHILAGLRNTGGANGHGFFWFYFVNEHFLRFLGRRTPRDYNKLPALLYWFLHLVWLFPWSFFTPTAAILLWRKRHHLLEANTPAKCTVVLLASFSALILVFFSLSTNQEYYTFPVYLPLLMLLAAAVSANNQSPRSLRASFLVLVLTGTLITIALAYGLWTSRHLAFNPDIGTVLSRRAIGNYTLSLSHFFDLTGASFAALRFPAALAATAFLIGPWAALLLARRQRTHQAILAIATTSAVFLMAAHVALVRFAPMLSSQAFAAQIQHLEATHQIAPYTQILLLGDQSYGSSIPFYLQQDVQLVDGRTSSMLFGSTFPDVPPVFVTSAQLAATWGSGPRKLLFVPEEQRETADRLLGPRRIVLFQRSGKALLTDRPLDAAQPSAVPSGAPLTSVIAPLTSVISTGAPHHSVISTGAKRSGETFSICTRPSSRKPDRSPMTPTSPHTHEAPRRLWRPRSLALIVLAWLILQLGGLFTPGSARRRRLRLHPDRARDASPPRLRHALPSMASASSTSRRSCIGSPPAPCTSSVSMTGPHASRSRSASWPSSSPYTGSACASTPRSRLPSIQIAPRSTPHSPPPPPSARISTPASTSPTSSSPSG